MMGTVRKRRSRNSYREVLLTYCRGRFLLNAVVCVPFYALTLQESFARLRDFAIVGFGAIVFPMLLSMHLKEMFSTSRARLTPGLYRAHFIVAAAWILVFAAFLPIGLSFFMLDGGGQRFARVAVCCARSPQLAVFSVKLPVSR